MRLRVSPGAKRTGTEGKYGEALKLAVTAPPVDGKADAGVERFPAELLEASKVLETLSGQPR